ncbi:MAG: DegT/DnrJ/EryC1/StrS family aminotransferase [Candidatus Omnitrophota bacterium]
MKKGQCVEAFESKFADYFAADSAIAFSQARVAIYFILKALSFPVGSELITTPVTIRGIINSILVNGLKPVFVDLGHNTGNMDVTQIEENITDRTRAILVTHLNGIPSKMDLIQGIADKHGLVVLEDTSQSIGAKCNGRYVGLLGTAGIFSISALKPLSTFTGGILLTNNQKLARQLKIYTDHLPEQDLVAMFFACTRELMMYFFSSRYLFSCFTFYAIKGMNLLSLKFFDSLQHMDLSVKKQRAEMPKEFLVSFTEYQAKIGQEAFKSFKADTERRSNMGYLLHSELMKASVPGLVEIPSNTYCVFWRFPLWVENPKKFRRYLFNRYIDTTVSGLDCCSREPIFKELSKYTPEAFRFINNMVFLPIHPAMSIRQIKYIVQVVCEYYEYCC